MNGEQFYTEFKYSLKFLGLSWWEKEKVKVSIQGNKILFSYKDMSIAYKLKKEKGADE